MVNRVALGKLGDGVTYGLEVSKAGFDVLTTGVENLAFSSKWGNAGSILLQGWFVGTTTVAPSATINYGATYGYYPMIIACLTNSTNTIVYPYNSYTSFIRSGGGGGGGSEGIKPAILVQAGLSSATINADAQGLPTGVAYGIRYFVLAIPGGS